MNLEEFLKLEYPQARMSIGDKWLYWDGDWVVLEHRYGAKHNDCLYRGQSLEDAIEEILK